MLSACQEEIEPEIEVNSENSILPASELSDFIVQVASLDGSADNIIDLSSCTTVIFPISGLYDEDEDEDDTIEDDDDYVEVTFNSIEEVLAFGVEALDIEWIYPINVLLSDHTAVVLSSSDDLDDIQDNCIEGGDDADIECIDFIYPITLSIFNNRTESVTTASIASDKEMYRVFNDPDQVISIEYPISLIDQQAEVTVVEDNQQLLERIRLVEGACDEQDIVDFDEDVLTDLGQLLVNSVWKIDLFEDGTNMTALYEGFTLDFRSDLTVIASSEDNTFEGEWELDAADAPAVLEFDFDEDETSFSLLNDAEWEVISFDQDTINLEVPSDGETTGKRLRLTR
ncbi:hypothetical protein SAMN05661096_00863 [Marivirga sericea]|uniref:Uncharacterized protein n=2 Tax=Marivirga sericea TaxID=1028 RepID=A0A1X7INL6_9BACT|nr:hypothetical protein SAMN05661096_00863 [Marivirga sericea]